MALSMTQLEQDPDFEPFLGATVGEDRYGINVTVLSMLARLGVDPWTEVAELAAISEGPARKRLDSLMVRFKDVPGLVSDRGKVISELLDFMPRKKASAKPTSQGGMVNLTVPPAGAPIYWIVAAVLLLGWIANLAHVQ